MSHYLQHPISGANGNAADLMMWCVNYSNLIVTHHCPAAYRLGLHYHWGFVSNL